MANTSQIKKRAKELIEQSVVNYGGARDIEVSHVHEQGITVTFFIEENISLYSVDSPLSNLNGVRYYRFEGDSGMLRVSATVRKEYRDELKG